MGGIETKYAASQSCSSASPSWEGVIDQAGGIDCSLAPSGVGFRSLYYVSHPQSRGKSRRELTRETSEKSELPSESAQQSTITNAIQVPLLLLVGTH